MSNEESLNKFREMMGYTDDQWDAWMSNPKNLNILNNAADIEKYKVTFEVTNSVGCAAGHKVGDKIVFNGAAGLMCKECPDTICAGLLAPINPMALDVLEKICNGEDPTKRAFNKVHCIDVGVEKGGWGAVVVEMKVEKNED